MNGNLFGTSGVRGVVNQDLTPDLCTNIGRALGSLLPYGSTVCIGTDTRLSRELIKNAVTSGLVECGINVVHLGIVPTPALAFLTREYEFSAGIMITASHNPPEYNGIKLFNRDGIGFTRPQEEQIENLFYRRDFRTGSAGSVDQLSHAYEKYAGYIKSLAAKFNFNLNHKLLIDPGNGAASRIASQIFHELNFKVIPFNDMPDGRFPGRNPEPKEDTLIETIKYLRQKNADLAICFAGDADWGVFCDQAGFIGFNQMASFISRQVIESTGRKSVATTIETGMLLDLAVQDLGAGVIRGRVGDVAVAHLARENNAALGVETVGVYIIPEAGYYPDSIFASLFLLSSLENISDIRKFVKSLPPLYFNKSKMHCPNEIKATVMQKIRQKIDILKPLEINDLDGLRLEFTGSWMLIRASGTEPAIRVLAESKGQAYTQELLNSGLSIVQNSLKEVLG